MNKFSMPPLQGSGFLEVSFESGVDANIFFFLYQGIVWRRSISTTHNATCVAMFSIILYYLIFILFIE